MAAGRFYIEGGALAAGAEVTLPDDVARQARDVLRLTVGEWVTLLDGVGGVYGARLCVVERKRVVVVVGERQVGDAEPGARVTLCQGMLKAAKFEWVIQKGVELGVGAFVPLLTERAVAATEEAGEAKRRRWGKIAVEAMEQCGGARLPMLEGPRSLALALAARPAEAIALLLWEEAEGVSLRQALHGALAERAGGQAGEKGEKGEKEVWLFVGPEGGFSAGEVALARGKGAVAVTLGARILRAETAAVVAAALTLEALGEMERPGRS